MNNPRLILTGFAAVGEGALALDHLELHELAGRIVAPSRSSAPTRRRPSAGHSVFRNNTASAKGDGMTHFVRALEALEDAAMLLGVCRRQVYRLLDREQRALRPAILEPPVLRAVDLDQLATTIPPVARLIRTWPASLAVLPHAGLDQSLAQGLVRNGDGMSFGEVLADHDPQFATLEPTQRIVS